MELRGNDSSTNERKVNLVLRMPPSLIEALREQARRNERTLSGEVRLALREYIASREAA